MSIIVFDSASVQRPALFGDFLAVDIPRDEPSATWWPELRAMLISLGYDSSCSRYAAARWIEHRGMINGCPVVEVEDWPLVNELVERSLCVADLKPVRRIKRDTITVNPPRLIESDTITLNQNHSVSPVTSIPYDIRDTGAPTVNRDIITVDRAPTAFVSPVSPVPSPLPLPKRPAPRPRPFEPTSEDRRWHAEDADRRERVRDRIVDEMFVERYGPEAMFEQQEYRGSLLGHPA